jgi:hypothetical protein
MAWNDAGDIVAQHHADGIMDGHAFHGEISLTIVMRSSPVDPEHGVAHPANHVGFGFKSAFQVIKNHLQHYTRIK